MTWVAVAVAAVGAVATVAGSALKGGGQQSTSSSQLEFPDETRRLFQDVEQPILAGNLQEQGALLQPFTGGYKPDQAQAAGFTGAQPLVENAARKGANTAGFGDLGPIFEDTAGISPVLINALRGLTLSRGAQVNAVVPPGYGQFLSPSTFTQTSQSGPSAFDTGFQVAGSLASIGGAYYNSTR